MLNSNSIKTRFLVSVASNCTRSIIAFFSGLLVARGLSPIGYGDFTFLMGSFAAIRTLLDMGSSNAFYTFAAQKPRSRNFYLCYFAWLTFQFVFTVILVAMVMPQAMIRKLWLGHSSSTILLALTATFMQQQVWQTVNQIGESARKTVRVQTVNMVLAISHLALVLILLIYNRLSVNILFWLIVGEYALATICSFWFLRGREEVEGGGDAEMFSFKTTLEEYKKYCKPMILVAWVGFLYQFADRWMLQRFGGPEQQGFYQIAYQFSAVSLLATSSILSIFWKEIAEAHGRGDVERVATVYHKVNRGLVMFGAILSGLFIPWTEQIVTVFLGRAYVMAVPVLMIMFLYPIHQSMGQIGGTMLLASGYTQAYMLISVVVMLVSLPFSYLAQAPASGLLISGLGLGALGMALKMVFLNIVSVNVLAWVIARYCKWKYDWLYQVVGIGSVIGLGFMAKLFVGLIWDLGVQKDRLTLILPFLCNAVIYTLAVACVIWMMPWLIGMTKADLREALIKLKKCESMTD